MLVSEKEDNYLILPMAFKIQFYTEQHPEIIVRLGSVLTPQDVQKNFHLFEDEFINNIDMLDQASFNRDFIREIIHGTDIL